MTITIPCNKNDTTIIFSLIVATYGRFTEIDSLLKSLAQQDLGIDKFEIILVDQNESNSLISIIEKHSTLNIIHMKSPKKGLSYNRNIGIALSTGAYVCFPDDDCTYYPNTLSTAYKHLQKENVSTVFGAIRDRATGENIIRNWPFKDQKLNRYNFFSLYSSITIFTKKNHLLFNEDLGVGCYFGSYEDSDYTYRTIKELGNCYYISDIEVWHPKAGVNQFTAKKNHSYGLGFGAFCAINKYDPYIIRLLFMSVGYHLLLSTLCLLRLDLNGSLKRLQAASSRVQGFIEYLRK